jgi:hypothetical protein
LTHTKANVTIDVLDFGGVKRPIFSFEEEDISDAIYALYDEFAKDCKINKLSKLFKALDDSNLPNSRKSK